MTPVFLFDGNHCEIANRILQTPCTSVTPAFSSASQTFAALSGTDLPEIPGGMPKMIGSLRCITFLTFTTGSLRAPEA